MTDIDALRNGFILVSLIFKRAELVCFVSIDYSEAFYESLSVRAQVFDFEIMMKLCERDLKVRIRLFYSLPLPMSKLLRFDFNVQASSKSKDWKIVYSFDTQVFFFSVKETTTEIFSSVVHEK